LSSSDVSAVYAITCGSTGKVYVGCAKRLRVRWADHRRLLRRGDHFNPRLQRAWNKYGEAAFSFSILEIVTPDNLLSRESELIAERNAANPLHGFNINPSGWSRLGRPHTTETIARMSAAKKGNPGRLGVPHTEETRALLSALFKGRRVSEETRERIRLARAKQVMLPETARKVSIANKGKAKPIGFGRRVAETQAFFTAEQVAALRKSAAEGISRRSLARQYGTSHNVISRAVDGRGTFYSTL